MSLDTVTLSHGRRIIAMTREYYRREDALAEQRERELRAIRHMQIFAPVYRSLYARQTPHRMGT